MTICQTSKPILQVRNVSQDFGVRVLANIDIDVGESECVAVVGASGVGKTTLFDIIAGMRSPSSGKVYLHGEDITAQAGYIGYMPQQDLLLPHYTLWHNVALPMKIAGASGIEIDKFITPLLPIFRLQDKKNAYPATLSGGERGRAALLRAYISAHIHQSTVLLLDEPFSAVDYITKHNLYTWFNQMRQNLQLSAIIITHDIDEALALCTRIYVLQGSPAQAKHFNCQNTPDIKNTIINSLNTDNRKTALNP